MYSRIGPGGTWVPKFQMPLWWQVLESAAVGIVATLLLYALYRLARWWLG